MTALTVIQNACDRLGIVRPSTVIDSADQQIRQLLGLAQQSGKELARRFQWNKLCKEKTFTATATETQSGAVPSDFDRMLNGTFYNRTANRRVEGPYAPDEWQSYKASTTNALFDAFRIRGGDILMAPTPTAGDSYAFEYVSTWWVATAAASTTPAQASWLDNTDVGILDEELLTDDLVWRFLMSKGLSYSEQFRTFEAHLMLAIARDGGRRTTVSFGKSSAFRGPRYPTFPDGSWPLS